MKLKNIKPLNNMLLVKNDPIEDAKEVTTKAGIIIIQNDESRPKDRSTLATVVKVGDYMYDKYGNKHNLEDLFKVGDRIMYYNPAGKVKVQLEEEGTYILLRAEDIDCLVED